MDLNPYVFSIDMPRSNLCFKLCFLFKKRHTISDSWITRLQINLIARYKHTYVEIYSGFFLRLAIGFYMLIFQPPVNFCSDENIQTIFGTKLEDFLNYRIDYNSISQTVEKVVKKIFFSAPKASKSGDRQVLVEPTMALLWRPLDVLLFRRPKIVICISRMRNRTLTTERKIVVKAALRPRQDNLEVVKGFRSQGVHILCATRKFVIIK
jgi:hypothetical protein